MGLMEKTSRRLVLLRVIGAYCLVAGGCFIDVKAAFPQAALAAQGLCVWRL